MLGVEVAPQDGTRRPVRDRSCGRLRGLSPTAFDRLETVEDLIEDLDKALGAG